MKIEDILYHTTRTILNVEDKMSIATIFIFCYKLDTVCFAKLLYTGNHQEFIDELMAKYDFDLSIKFRDTNIHKCFYDTLEKVKERYDKDGFYKAVFMEDPFALAVIDIIDTFDRTINKRNL